MTNSNKKLRPWKTFNIPKYIENLLKRSEFVLNSRDGNNWFPGYTIRLYKRTEYATIYTLDKEAAKLVTWARSYCSENVAEYLYCPDKTHYCDQYAIINIFDPIMAKIEKLIRSEKEIKRDLY